MTHTVSYEWLAILPFINSSYPPTSERTVTYPWLKLQSTDSINRGLVQDFAQSYLQQTQWTQRSFSTANHCANTDLRRLQNLCFKITSPWTGISASLEACVQATYTRLDHSLFFCCSSMFWLAITLFCSTTPLFSLPILSGIRWQRELESHSAAYACCFSLKTRDGKQHNPKMDDIVKTGIEIQEEAEPSFQITDFSQPVLKISSVLVGSRTRLTIS